MSSVTTIEAKAGESFREHIYRLMTANQVKISRGTGNATANLPHVSVTIAGLDPDERASVLVFCRAALSNDTDPDKALEDFQLKVMRILRDGSPLTLPHPGIRLYAPTQFDRPQTPRTTRDSISFPAPRTATTLIPVDQA